MKKTISILLILFLILSLTGCRRGDQDPNKPHVYDYPDYPSRLGSYQVVINDDILNKTYNLDLLDQFIEDTSNDIESHLDFGITTKEGDVIIRCVNYLDGKFNVVSDHTRDKYSTLTFVDGSYDFLVSFTTYFGTYYILTNEIAQDDDYSKIDCVLLFVTTER